jgi:hypothetical protein
MVLVRANSAVVHNLSFYSSQLSILISDVYFCLISIDLAAFTCWIRFTGFVFRQFACLLTCTFLQINSVPDQQQFNVQLDLVQLFFE